MKKGIVFLLVLTMVLALPACKAPAQQSAGTPTKESAVATSAPAVASVAPTVTPTAAPTVIVTTAAPTEAPTAAATEAETQVTASDPTESPTETSPTEAPTETSPTEAPTETAPTAAPTEIPTEDTTPHSELYIPGVSQDQMLEYFYEVVLDMEYIDGEGDATLVQKWDRPISYRIEGVPDHRDAQLLSEFVKQLNKVEGFPGIRAATGLEQNVTIYFLHDEEFKTQFSHVIENESADGAVQFWYYNNTNGIYSGRIGYRKDAPQAIRESVIPEEIVNLLGISDTILRKDSIIYQYGSEVTEPSAVDWAIIKLLYNPKIQCGMNAAECEPIIRELYY